LDLGTLIGIVAGSLLLGWAVTKNGSLLDFIDPAALAITLGGTLAATLINYPLSRLKETAQIIRRVFATTGDQLPVLIDSLVAYAERARRQGLLALEEDAASATDPFLRKGLGLVVDGIDQQVIRSILENDLAALEQRHKQGAALFESMAQYAPAFGLIGTLIGLVSMLRAISSPAQIGPGMAVALLTTLYGALLANLIFLPIAGKLKVRSAEEVLRKEVMLEGILAIQAGDGPSVLMEKLNAFLAPGSRPEQLKGHSSMVERLAAAAMDEEE
jgi:chemotaxis protein MotA